MTAPTLLKVHLLGLPVALAATARQHFEELSREFELIAAGMGDHPDGPPVPQRLMQLVDALRQQYSGLNTEADQRLDDAIDSGAPVIDDHVLELPTDAGPASQALGDMIDEADDYCLQGEHLLTLATPPDCVLYRRWFLSEVVQQLSGATPVPWSDYAAAHAT